MPCNTTIVINILALTVYEASYNYLYTLYAMQNYVYLNNIKLCE